MQLHDLFLGGEIETQVDTTGGGSFTLSSSGLASMPVVASPDVMSVVLDAHGRNGAPEIATVTAHSSGASTATFTGSVLGSLGRVHYTNEYWVHSFLPGIDMVDFDPTWIVVDSGGSAPAFQNSWVNANGGTVYDSTHSSAAFRRLVSGLVVITGIVSGGNVGTTAFTLPAGYRPLNEKPFTTWDGTGSTSRLVVVLADGSVQPTPVSNGNSIWLDGISFFAEA